MRLGRVVVTAALVAAGVACSLLTPLDDLGATPDASTVDAANEAIVDAACKAELKSDPMNCGACGRDCCGGACVQGVCQPRVLASQQPVVSFVRADDKYAFWTTGTNTSLSPVDLMRVGLDGTGLSKIANARKLINGYSQDAQYLYWLEFIPFGFFVVAVAKDAPVTTDAGAPYTRMWAIDSNASNGLASFMFVDAADAYWIAGSQPECTNSTLCLYKAPTANLRAGDGGYEVVAPATIAFAGGFGQDQDYFYVWVTGNTIVRVRKTAAPDGGSAAEPMIANLPSVSGLTSNSTRIYWSDTPAATIYSAPKVPNKDGGPNQVFATLQNEPTGLEADDSDVYWANSDGIVTCPTTGCPNGPDKPRVLLKESGIVSFALTKKCFVWANQTTATVNVVGR